MSTGRYLERHLIIEVGTSVRERFGLARLTFATQVEQIVDCFVVEELAPTVFALRAVGGELLSPRFPKASVGSPILAFARVAEQDVGALREAYLHLEGKPLFTLRAGSHSE